MFPSIFPAFSLGEVTIFCRLGSRARLSKAVSTVSALLCVAAIGGLATMSTANAGCKFGALVGDGTGLGPGGWMDDVHGSDIFDDDCSYYYVVFLLRIILPTYIYVLFLLRIILTTYYSYYVLLLLLLLLSLLLSLLLLLVIMINIIIIIVM